MSLKYGKTEVAAMSSVLDAEHASLEDAAKAALAAAEEIFEKRAQFVVVGQLSGTKEREKIPPSDREAIKVSLGWYSTEGDALKAAESLWFNSGSGDRYRCWVLPTFHGTPAELHEKAKERYAAAEEKRKQAATEKLKASIEKRMKDAEIRNNGGKGSCINCGHQPYDHRPDGSSRGKCALTECDCIKWSEKTK